MASKNIQARGGNFASFHIHRDPSNGDVVFLVEIAHTDGTVSPPIGIAASEVIGNLQAADLNGLKSALADIYQLALTKAGYA